MTLNGNQVCITKTQTQRNLPEANKISNYVTYLNWL